MTTEFTYIILINWNGFEDTVRCINSLLISSDFKSIKIVVVDNGSSKKEGEKLKTIFPNTKVILSAENLGFTGGNNLGLNFAFRQADCGHIMILNNDTTVEKDFLKPLREYLNSSPKSIVGSKLLYLNKPTKIQTLGGKLMIGGTINIGKNKDSQKYSKITHPDFISGACILASEEAWKDIGLLDNNFFAYFEDLDWCIRAHNKGYELAIIPESIVYHEHSKSLRGSTMKAYFIIRNSIYFARKHYKFVKKAFFIINAILIGVILNLLRYRNLSFAKNFYRGIKDGFASRLGNPF